MTVALLLCAAVALIPIGARASAGRNWRGKAMGNRRRINRDPPRIRQRGRGR